MVTFCVKKAVLGDLMPTYMQARWFAASGTTLPWPAPVALLLKFVAHQMWEPEKRKIAADHGMPEAVTQSLQTQRFLQLLGPKWRVQLAWLEVGDSAGCTCHATVEEAREC